ncbi:hypothetical protein GH714_018432 [Hevea brasiliensis]|uniref:DUF4283 domain-containing protein n=1 Tax=Hevea brasiliensis TaxID=3981 RepID=A0A6A6LIV7_HEVBR|nr:hypothetical protein GH714_018432 [Hevea brasiliensis]
MHPAEPSLSDIISKTESLSSAEPMLELISSDDSGFHVTDNKLVAWIIGTRKYSPWVLKSTMSKIWKLISDVQVQRGPEGSFIFIFEDVKERDEVLEEEPWLLDNNLLILKKWPPDKSFQALDFSTTGFWLQVHSLPPSNWNQQNAQKIGQLFGGLICVDNVQGPSQEWHPFLRLKVRGILPGIAMGSSMVILPLHLGLGLGQPQAVRALRELIVKHSPSIVFLMETKKKRKYLESVRRKLGFTNEFYVDPCGLSWGLALWWTEETQISVLNACPNFVDCDTVLTG